MVIGIDASIRSSSPVPDVASGGQSATAVPEDPLAALRMHPQRLEPVAMTGLLAASDAQQVAAIGQALTQEERTALLVPIFADEGYPRPERKKAYLAFHGIDEEAFAAHVKEAAGILLQPSKDGNALSSFILMNCAPLANAGLDVVSEVFNVGTNAAATALGCQKTAAAQDGARLLAVPTLSQGQFYLPGEIVAASRNEVHHATREQIRILEELKFQLPGMSAGNIRDRMEKGDWAAEGKLFKAAAEKAAAAAGKVGPQAALSQPEVGQIIKTLAGDALKELKQRFDDAEASVKPDMTVTKTNAAGAAVRALAYGLITVPAAVGSAALGGAPGLLLAMAGGLASNAANIGIFNYWADHQGREALLKSQQQIMDISIDHAAARYREQIAAGRSSNDAARFVADQVLNGTYRNADQLLVSAVSDYRQMLAAKGWSESSAALNEAEVYDLATRFQASTPEGVKGPDKADVKKAGGLIYDQQRLEGEIRKHMAARAGALVPVAPESDDQRLKSLRQLKAANEEALRELAGRFPGLIRIENTGTPDTPGKTRHSLGHGLLLDNPDHAPNPRQELLALQDEKAKARSQFFEPAASRFPASNPAPDPLVQQLKGKCAALKERCDAHRNQAPLSQPGPDEAKALMKDFGAIFRDFMDIAKRDGNRLTGRLREIDYTDESQASQLADRLKSNPRLQESRTRLHSSYRAVEGAVAVLTRTFAPTVRDTKPQDKVEDQHRQLALDSLGLGPDRWLRSAHPLKPAQDKAFAGGLITTPDGDFDEAAVQRMLATAKSIVTAFDALPDRESLDAKAAVLENDLRSPDRGRREEAAGRYGELAQSIANSGSQLRGDVLEPLLNAGAAALPSFIRPDGSAATELRNLLTPVVMVPIGGEDAAFGGPLGAPSDRLAAYGQHDPISRRGPEARPYRTATGAQAEQLLARTERQALSLWNAYNAALAAAGAGGDLDHLRRLAGMDGKIASSDAFGVDRMQSPWTYYPQRGLQALEAKGRKALAACSHPGQPDRSGLPPGRVAAADPAAATPDAVPTRT